MNSITIIYPSNLTDEQQSELLSLSKVGNAVMVKSGETVIYNRLRNISFEDLSDYNVWTFRDKLEDETLDEYNADVKVETEQAFTDLAVGNIDCIWLSESGFGNLSKQEEFINS